MSDDAVGRRLVRNAAANASVGILGLVVLVFVTPLLVRRLGPEQYGLWALAASFSAGQGWLALSDIGFQAGLVKRVSELTDPGRTDADGRLLSTAMALLASLGVAGAAVVVGAAWLLPPFIDAGSIAQSIVRSALLLVAVEVVVVVPGMALQGYLLGRQLHGRARVADALRHLVFGIGATVVVLSGGGVRGVIAVQVAAAIGSSTVLWLQVRRTFPAPRLRPRLVRRAEATSMASFGGWAFMSRASGVVWRHMDRIILATLLTTTQVALFDVAARVQIGLSSLVSFVTMAVMPAISNLQARGRDDSVLDVLVRGTRYTVMGSAPLSIGVIVMADLVIQAWVGPEFSESVVLVRFLVAYQLLTAIIAVPLATASGRGHIKPLAMAVGAVTVANLVASVVLVAQFEVLGAVVATFVSYVLLAPMFLKVALTDLDLSRWQFLRTALQPIAPAALVFAALCVGLRALVQPTGLLVGIGLCAVALVGYGATLRVAGIDAEEWRLLRDQVRR